MNEDQLESEQPVRSPLLMSPATAALLVIDVQQKLIPYISNRSRLVWNIRRLLRGAQILDLETFSTEQYPRGLGSTIPEIADLVSADEEKTRFSCRDCGKVVDRLKKENRFQILMCGIETHVCVQQSAFDFASMGFDVLIPVDAVGSRSLIDHETALRRMEQSGITLTTTESALFEWCEVSGTPEFKQISQLVREAEPQA